MHCTHSLTKRMNGLRSRNTGATTEQRRRSLNTGISCLHLKRLEKQLCNTSQKCVLFFVTRRQADSCCLFIHKLTSPRKFLSPCGGKLFTATGPKKKVLFHRPDVMSHIRRAFCGETQAPRFLSKVFFPPEFIDLPSPCIKPVPSSQLVE